MFATLRRLFETKSSLASPSPELLALFGATPTAAGAAVTPETALRCPAVYGAVKVLSESVAQLPLHLYKRTAEGSKERAADHPLYELLHDAPNEWSSSYEFRVAMQTALCLHGNAYAFINRDASGRVVELVQLPSQAVSVEADELTGEPAYRITERDGGQRLHDRRQIFHLRALGAAGHVGVAPIQQAREAIGLSLAMEEHAARLFSAGARPSGVFKIAKALGPETLKRLRESFSAAHAGGANAGKTLILEDGMTFEPLQFSAVDLQFLELRRYQVAEIARVFRVPLHMLGDLERATFSNVEHLGRQFLSFTLLPHLKLWEGAIRRALLLPGERRDYFAEFLTDDIARADLAARFEAYAKAITNGVLSPNEVRAAENRAPYPGGNRYSLPLNTEDVRRPRAAA